MRSERVLRDSLRTVNRAVVGLQAIAADLERPGRPTDSVALRQTAAYLHSVARELQDVVSACLPLPAVRERPSGGTPGTTDFTAEMSATERDAFRRWLLRPLGPPPNAPPDDEPDDER
jgi:hypothetical protein